HERNALLGAAERSRRRCGRCCRRDRLIDGRRRRMGCIADGDAAGLGKRRA
ncbi:hypothetical protein chiPu_0032489, partial [Chiloscyllium punctatum]|nr:hypothetical protein [Chiloscyllium punctatum]